MSISYFPIHGPAGVDRIACVLQDITERKRAEVALLRSEERFSKAFCNNRWRSRSRPEPKGAIWMRMKALLQLLGYERREVIGHTSAELHFWPNLRIARKYCRNSTRRKTWCGAIRDTGPRRRNSRSRNLDGIDRTGRTSLPAGNHSGCHRGAATGSPVSASPEDGSRWAFGWGRGARFSIIYWVLFWATATFRWGWWPGTVR